MGICKYQKDDYCISILVHLSHFIHVVYNFTIILNLPTYTSLKLLTIYNN